MKLLEQQQHSLVGVICIITWSVLLVFVSAAVTSVYMYMVCFCVKAKGTVNIWTM